MPEIKTATPIYDVLPGEVLACAVSFDGFLESGEALTGTPTVEEQATSDLTFANITVGSGSKTINGVSVAIARWMSFKVTVASSPAATGKHYALVTVTTDSSPAQTPKVRIILNIKSTSADD